MECLEVGKASLYASDVIDFLSRIEGSPFDLTITSPPYGLDKAYAGVSDRWAWEDYLAWVGRWGGLLLGATSEGGRLCLNVPVDTNLGGHRAFAAEMTLAMQLAGWRYETTIPWDKLGGRRNTAFGCYDDRTKVLTKRGLIPFADVNLDIDLFATLNLQTRLVEYQRATQAQVVDYDGDLVTCATSRVDFRVTPDHNMIRLLGEDNVRAELVPAESFLGRNVVMPKASNGCDEGEEQEYFTLPAVAMGKNASTAQKIEAEQPLQIRMDDWLAFLGIFLTDGGAAVVKTSYNTTLNQTKAHNIQPILDLLERLPFRFRHYPVRGEFIISSKRLTTYLVETYGKKRERRFPRFVLDLSRRQRQIFIDWLMMGDGIHEIGSTTEYRRFCTPSSEFADGMKNLFVMNGYAFSTHMQEPSERGEILGVPTTCSVPLHMFSFHRSQTFEIKKGHARLEPYSGKVYCVSVPNRTLMVERNGKMMWCGNSWLRASAPAVVIPYEVILVFSKGDWKRPENGRASTITAEEFLEWRSTPWRFPGESSKKRKHPAPFPEELPRRLIRLFSFTDDLIFDPFVGSGTTCEQAEAQGRSSVGVDQHLGYLQELAAPRIRRAADVRDGVVVDADERRWESLPLVAALSPA